MAGDEVKYHIKWSQIQDVLEPHVLLASPVFTSSAHFLQCLTKDLLCGIAGHCDQGRLVRLRIRGFAQAPSQPRSRRMVIFMHVCLTCCVYKKKFEKAYTMKQVHTVYIPPVIA
jgi:hypothetical protein